MGDRAKSFQEEQQVVEIRAKLLVIDDAVIGSSQKGVPRSGSLDKSQSHSTARILLKAPAPFNEVRPHISSSFPRTLMRSPFHGNCTNCTSSAQTKQTLQNSLE